MLHKRDLFEQDRMVMRTVCVDFGVSYVFVYCIVIEFVSCQSGNNR